MSEPVLGPAFEALLAEREAGGGRSRAERSAGARRALANSQFAVELDEVRLEREERERKWPDADRLLRAFLLAPTSEVAEALLHGERVPLDRLDPDWVARFGRRSR